MQYLIHPHASLPTFWSKSDKELINNIAPHWAQQGETMANSVTGQVIGGQSLTFDGVNTVKELADLMNLGDNYTVKINNQEATYESSLQDFNFVAFGEKVKGGSVC